MATVKENTVELFWMKKSKKEKRRESNWSQDQSIVPLYHSPRWRKLRRRIKMENPTCQMVGCTQPAHTCDHKEPFKKGMDFFDENNLWMLCKSCNATKTANQKTTKFTPR